MTLGIAAILIVCGCPLERDANGTHGVPQRCGGGSSNIATVAKHVMRRGMAFLVIKRYSL